MGRLEGDVDPHCSVPAVGFMVMKGLLLHKPEIEELMAEFPKTTVILDHLAFCPGGDLEDPSWDYLMSLAKHDNVYVKISAFFRVTKEPWPYQGLRGKIRSLVDAFGADRLMWGSDWPWLTEVRPARGLHGTPL